MNVSQRRGYGRVSSDMNPHVRQSVPAPMPYPQVAGRSWGAAKRLDRERLTRGWEPMLSLEEMSSSHLSARAPARLWRMCNSELGADEESRPRFSIWHPAGLRALVLRQARSEPNDQAGIWKEVGARVRGLRGEPPLRRLQVMTLLGQLTLQRTALSLAVTPDDTVVGQHLRYLQAFLAWQVDSDKTAAVNELAAVADEAREPSLSVTAANVLAVHFIRFEPARPLARHWLQVAHVSANNLSREPQWLELLVSSRLWRGVALLHFRYGKRTDSLAAMRETISRSAELLEVCADDPRLDFLARENRRVALVTLARAYLGQDPAPVSPLLAELNEIEPDHPDTQLTLGDLYFRSGNMAVALSHYDRAAAAGTSWGAVAAFRAYQCCHQLGDSNAARDRLELLRDLDPAAAV